MVFEGNTTPGRSSKNSLLSREFKHADIHHQSVCTEGVAKVKKRDLTYDEKKLMNCEIEHDRMLLNGYDRQSASFQAIDEFDFLSIEPMGWKLRKDPNGSLMIGGLRSPCMNARYPIDHVDRLGQVLRSFDGVFEFEREREFYYIEYNMRSLRVLKKNEDDDSIRECRVVRTLANM